MRIESYADSLALIRGLGTLKQSGLTARGMLFLALSAQGRIYLGLPEQPGQLEQTELRVGEKLALRWPEDPALPQRLYHFDSIHTLRDDFSVHNGDRRLSQTGNAVEVGNIIARFVRSSGHQSVFFGCMPHQPGTWLQGGAQVVALHDFGVVEVVPVPTGLLARRLHDHRLYFLTFADIARTGHLEGWLPIYAAPFGNILLVERRVVRDRLVLSCEHGLVELALHELPQVHERARLPLWIPPPPSDNPFSEEEPPEVVCPAVLGRMDNEAFVLTHGHAQPWGLRDLAPAEVWGSPSGELNDITSWLLQLGVAAQPL
jgi:hypothetical protein